VSDAIQLVLPAQEDFHHIARLVVGGLAARLELTYEQLEDLEVALDALLRCRDDEGDLSIALTVEGNTVRTTVGPFSAPALAGLERESETLGLRRVLETVTDGLRVEQRDGGSWVELTKAAPG
jgi:hypothetical protein